MPEARVLDIVDALEMLGLPDDSRLYDCINIHNYDYRAAFSGHIDEGFGAYAEHDEWDLLEELSSRFGRDSEDVEMLLNDRGNPIVVVRTDTEDLIGDGWHRCELAWLLGEPTIFATILIPKFDTND